MESNARKALATIRRCLGANRVRLTVHFRLRLAERGLLWTDLLTLLESPVSMRADGFDDWGRSRWLVSGHAAEGTALTLVCAIGRARGGALTVFVTLFWED